MIHLKLKSWLRPLGPTVPYLNINLISCLRYSWLARPAFNTATFTFAVCRTCPHVNSSSTITTPKGHVYITGHFSCITEHVVYCLSCTKCPSIVYIGETGRRLADCFREHRRDINGRNDLPVPARFNQPNHTLEDMKVAVLKAGLANQEYRKKQEMRLIFK